LQGGVLIASRSEPSLARIDALGGDGPREVARVALPAAPRAIAVGTLAGDQNASALCIDRTGTLHRWDGTSALQSQDGFPAQASCLLLAQDGTRLMVGDQPGRKLELYRLEGDRFVHAHTIALDGMPRDLAEADLDGDGDTELLVAGGDHYLWTFGANGTAWSDPALTRETGEVPLRLEPLPAAEGTPQEFLLLPFYRLQAMRYEGLKLEVSDTTYAGQTPWDLSSRDWNGDGLFDIAIANRDAHRISVLFGEHPDGLRVDTRIRAGLGPSAVIGLPYQATDHRWLASFASLSNEVLVTPPFGGLNLTLARPNIAGPGAGNPCLALLEEGELLELLWTSRETDETGAPRAELNRLCPIDDDRIRCTLGPVGKSAADLCRVPLASGEELWVADEDDARLRQFRFDAGELKPIGTLDPGGAPVALTSWMEGEIPHVAAACRGAGTTTQVVVYRYSGTEWKEIARHGAALIPLDLEAADVDGDGDIDLCLLGKPREGDGPGAATVFLRAQGDWKETPQLETGLRPFALASGDLDGDGRADVVVSAQNSHHLNLYFGRAGDAPLERSADLGAGIGSLGLWIGDVDGDGSPEIVAANAFSNDLSLIHSDAR